jgi:hypothetical protein
LSKSCQKIVKSCQKVAIFLQKVVKKVVKKLSKNGQKLSKSSKVVKKLTKGNGHFMCHGKQIKRTNQQTVVGGGGGGRWVGGEIVVPRPLASASLTGRRQKVGVPFALSFTIKVIFFNYNISIMSSY